MSMSSASSKVPCNCSFCGGRPVSRYVRRQHSKRFTGIMSAVQLSHDQSEEPATIDSTVCELYPQYLLLNLISNCFLAHISCTLAVLSVAY